jgi:hypothetical protein
MSSAYERVLERSKLVLSDEHRQALGRDGIEALYDAVMIMAFADGDVCDEETRFMNDLAEFLGCSGSSDSDLMPEALLERLVLLKLGERAAEAIMKILLIVSDLDNHIDDDELSFWVDVGQSLNVSAERMTAIKKLLISARTTTRRFENPAD